MKIKSFALILALFGFSASLFAQPVTYSFSSFGGGLPSSAKKVSLGASDTATSQRIIIEDDDDLVEPEPSTDDYYNYPEQTTTKTKKTTNAGTIAAYVVLGVAVVAGIAVGTYYFSTSSGKCCESATEGMIEGCSEGCAESCSKSCTDACADSMAEACSASAEDACSSSTSSVTCEPTSATLAGLFTGSGLSLIPIYVP